jgi:hypothetical protein
MPPTKIKPGRDFDAALNAYLESIQHKKTALLAAVHQPSVAADNQYHAAAVKEKEARRACRKATKDLYPVARRSR